mmetsp:Transcript_33204/g.53462  ORF Transcript_33204/g.53462 Transcript_33204/m.53462 type:complete len:156 (-) Transcript_33204:4117-4584(-)
MRVSSSIVFIGFSLLFFQVLGDSGEISETEVDTEIVNYIHSGFEPAQRLGADCADPKEAAKQCLKSFSCLKLVAFPGCKNMKKCMANTRSCLIEKGCKINYSEEQCKSDLSKLHQALADVGKSMGECGLCDATNSAISVATFSATLVLGAFLFAQ